MQACLETENVSMHWLALGEIKIVFWARYQAIPIPKPLDQKSAENGLSKNKISSNLTCLDYLADSMHGGQISDVG